MSGTPHSPPGDRIQHIQAARDWLARAEKQFAAGDSVLAAGTLMLAKAELKLLVEGVASGVRSPVAQRPAPAFRLSRAGRTLLGAGALAACLLLGMIVGRTWLSPSPDWAPTEPAGPQVAAVDIPSVPAEIPETSPVEEVGAPAEEAPKIEEVEEVLVAEAPTPPAVIRTPTRRPARPRPPAETVSTPPVSPAPVEEPEPEAAEPVETATEPESGGFHPAEVALRTIRALTERLLNGAAK